MQRVISIGIQGFEKIRTENYFYVDKTGFIKEWWETGADVTLITRPRRFGKTLNMDMLNCFFSNRYKDRGDLFEGLSIWEEEKYHSLQGTYPVIFLSFAWVKEENAEAAKCKIKELIARLYEDNRYLLEGSLLSENEKKMYLNMTAYMNDTEATFALNSLCMYLNRYYGKKVLLFLDEYDTPMQEAYLGGYWNDFAGFMRSMFNSVFKTNPYLERAVMTGITRISKESMFSDLNNLQVITVTSDKYNTCFGFTEKEVFQALDEFGLSDERENVKKWYDGFVFGSQRDIYNPWSITGFLDSRKYQSYWTATSSNNMAGRLIQTASAEVKKQMEELLQGKEIVVHFDEQIVFTQLDTNETAIWSLLMASGYLRAECVEYLGETRKPWYHLKITNLETKDMFETMFAAWFQASGSGYHNFVRALLQDDVEMMNYYMNRVASDTFSYFDVGGQGSGLEETERFYHGFVLGLMAEQTDNYILKSNRESGFGRYDVMMIPKKDGLPAIIMEFKVRNPGKEKTLEETVQTALNQIEDKKYDVELISGGIPAEKIRHYGFAFDGKTVLIG